MTSPHQQLFVSVTADGVVLQPRHGREAAVQLAYGTGVATKVTSPPQIDSSVETHGVVGIIDLVSTKYLTLITNREQVAAVEDKPIYTITDVAYVPLTSKDVASEAIEAIRKRLHAENHSNGYASEDSDHIAEEETSQEPPATTSVTSAAKKAVQDVKGFSTFAQKWMTKGSTPPAKQADKDLAGLEPVEDDAKALHSDDLPVAGQEGISGRSEEPDPAQDNRHTTIDTYGKRILRNARLYYSSKSFFFSYDHNLSLRWADLAHQDPSTPLHKRFEPDFFWNRHVCSTFIDAELHQYILPVIQGFVGQRTFTLEQNASTTSTFFVTLISRRSAQRAGLRYLRRGVDEHGNVANCVETEQILWAADKAIDQSYSLLQLRGSIPLFFSQSPYSFKPLPQTFGSQATNREALKKHFEHVSNRYGQVQVASLVDKHGTEMGIGQAYEEAVQWMNETASEGQEIAFEWFDFHKECKGMRFENVSTLIKTLQQSLETFGWTVSSQGSISSKQKGVLRTNCMDCLDRTNVTQSSIGGWILQRQMKELGFDLDLTTDMKSIWFNQLWADNGDAISRQYAGTAALKGDFTRTRKRNWTGALSDFSLTLNRFYNNIFGDYFLQTCIDYLLGNIGPSAFDDFETSMVTQDYALDVRRVRQNAIDTCIKIVIEDPAESLFGGWTLSCPNKANSLRSLPFEECVLLLTDAALYFCRFDWSSEKVGSFERIDLAEITSIWRGPYITSALGTTETDETRNVGFALCYDTRGNAMVRTNTRSMDNEKAAVDQNAGKDEAQKQAQPHKDQRRLLAFKMLHSSAFVSKGNDHDESGNEAKAAERISTAIADAMVTAIRNARGVDHLNLDQAPKVEEKPVISLVEAKKSTGYVESIGYSIKKLVW